MVLMKVFVSNVGRGSCDMVATGIGIGAGEVAAGTGGRAAAFCDGIGCAGELVVAGAEGGGAAFSGAASAPDALAKAEHEKRARLKRRRGAFPFVMPGLWRRMVYKVLHG